MTNTSDSLTDVLRLLEREHEALRATVEQIPVALRERRPSPDGWSAAEVLEHLARVERGVAKLVALRGREQPVGQAIPVRLDDSRVARLRGRGERIVAPERVRPSGTLNAAEALRALEEARDSLCEAVKAADPASLDGCTHAHAVLGVLTLRDWIAFVAHHEARHAAQIFEIGQALT